MVHEAVTDLYVVKIHLDRNFIACSNSTMIMARLVPRFIVLFIKFEARLSYMATFVCDVRYMAENGSDRLLS